jgi:hypothetical protein
MAPKQNGRKKNGNNGNNGNNVTQPNGRKRVANAANTIPGLRRKRLGASGVVSTFNKQTVAVEGYDFISTVSFPRVLVVANSRLVNIGLSPAQLSGTRWAQMAVMYEKYRMLSCTMVYVPAVSSVIGGQMISYWELDPTDEFGTAAGLQADIRIAMAHQNSKMHNIYDTVSVAMPLRTGIADFFVERSDRTDNPRWTQQGVFRMIATAGISGLYDNQMDEIGAGSIYLRWNCLFKNPQIQAGLMVPLSSDLTSPQTTISSTLSCVSGVPSNTSNSLAISTVSYGPTAVPKAMETYHSSNVFTDGTYDKVYKIQEPVGDAWTNDDSFENTYSNAIFTLRERIRPVVYPRRFTKQNLELRKGEVVNDRMFVVYYRADDGLEFITPNVSATASGNMYNPSPDGGSVFTNFFNMPAIKVAIRDGVAYMYDLVMGEGAGTTAFSMLRSLGDLLLLIPPLVAIEQGPLNTARYHLNNHTLRNA